MKNGKHLLLVSSSPFDPNQTFFHILPHGHERAMAQLPANIFCICRLALLRCS
jgi:hypothetical protein